MQQATNNAQQKNIKEIFSKNRWGSVELQQIHPDDRELIKQEIKNNSIKKLRIKTLSENVIDSLLEIANANVSLKELAIGDTRFSQSAENIDKLKEAIKKSDFLISCQIEKKINQHSGSSTSLELVDQEIGTSNQYFAEIVNEINAKKRSIRLSSNKLTKGLLKKLSLLNWGNIKELTLSDGGINDESLLSILAILENGFVA